jgi:hypothetical protein
LELLNKKIVVEKQSRLIQTFPEVCRYSCSKGTDESRTFELTREYYLLTLFNKFSFKFFESVAIKCTNCNWKSKLPANFAKKVFKKGLNSHLLIRYAQSRVISSRPLNYWGDLWRIWLISFGFLLAFTILRMSTEPILYSQPKEVIFDDLYNQENAGKVVQVSGKADYSLAVTKDIILNGKTSKVIGQEVYIPLFSKTNTSDFILIKGGTDDLIKVNGRAGVTNLELIKNQDYTIIGSVDDMASVKNEEIISYFTSQIPKKKGYNVPKIVVNSADLITFKSFALRLIPYYIFILFCLISAICVQIYIDKKIALKR